MTLDRGRYKARTRGSKTPLGSYETAEDAAVAFGRWAQQEASRGTEAWAPWKGLPTEAQGVKLHLATCKKSATGYEGVHPERGRFRVKSSTSYGHRPVHLGCFDTALERHMVDCAVSKCLAPAASCAKSACRMDGVL